ncbi:MAG: alkaline phosphatase family protein [Planctomycetota bacterium]
MNFNQIHQHARPQHEGSGERVEEPRASATSQEPPALAGGYAANCRIAPPGQGRGLLPGVLAVVSLCLCGCAADRPLNVHVPKDVRLPDRAAVVFFIDGFGETQFEQALAEGRIPNIAAHLLDRGVRVEKAVTCVPSITYAISATFITGRLPGHHGIVSNKWFEPSTGRFQNYCYIKTYQRVDQDYDESPTIYDILGRRVTVSIQTAIRRGVTHTIDNWATSGINWFFGNTLGVDCLVAQRLELIAERTQGWGRWPDLIWVYFPGDDRIGHLHGPRSPQYAKAIANIDRQIGRVCDALADIGMYDRTCLCLVSDHGMVEVAPEQYFDIPAFLAERTGGRVWSNDYTEPGDEERLLRDYDYACAVSASRWAAVWPLPRVMQEPWLLADARSLLPSWVAEAIDHPAVELAAVSFRPGRVHAFTKRGHALIVRHEGKPDRYAVYQRPGEEILDHASADSGAGGAEFADSRQWLRLTADSRYPDFVPQIVAYFDSERSGNIVFFAADGWDFSKENPRGGHGSILPGEMRVPMVLAGPGLSGAVRIPFARNTDVMPTLLHLLGAEPVLPDGTRVDIDGTNLLPSSALGDGD